jgi:galactokinase
MMGGGFGGCTINLMDGGDHRRSVKKMSENYYRVTGIIPDIYECEIGQGVCEMPVVNEWRGKN